MNAFRQSVELLPLSDSELHICLLLLRTPLNRPKEVRVLIKEIEGFLFRRPFELFRWGILKDPLAKAVEEPGERRVWRKETREQLYGIQAEWSPRIMTGPIVLGAPEDPDFDKYCLAGELHLPAIHCQDHSVGGKVRKTFVAVAVGTTTELFEMFLIRAVINGQLSRFAHCVVCGRWSLKRRSGKRSRSHVVFEYSKQHPNWLDWPLFWRSLPRWPALCGENRCKNRFENVVRSRSAFRRKDFPGLCGKGTTLYMNRKPQKYRELPARFEIIRRLTEAAKFKADQAKKAK